jgi:hypothetical protein
MKARVTNTILFILLLVYSVFLGNCSHTKQTEDLAIEKKQSKGTQEVVIVEKEPLEQIQEAITREKEQPLIIQIQRLSVTDETITLNYRLSNPNKEDIWVCYDIGVYGKQEVQGAAMRIDGETVRIQLRCNIERFPGFQDPIPVAKYVRLQPGESCTGKIVRDSPIKEHKVIFLHHAIFEVGYFSPKWNKFFDSLSKESKKEKIKPKPKVIGQYYHLPDNPLITEEILDSQLCEVMYLHELFTTWISNEEFAEVVVNDITIPCSIVVDDK